MAANLEPVSVDDLVQAHDQILARHPDLRTEWYILSAHLNLAGLTADAREGVLSHLDVPRNEKQRELRVAEATRKLTTAYRGLNIRQQQCQD